MMKGKSGKGMMPMGAKGAKMGMDKSDRGIKVPPKPMGMAKGAQMAPKGKPRKGK